MVISSGIVGAKVVNRRRDDEVARTFGRRSPRAGIEGRRYYLRKVRLASPPYGSPELHKRYLSIGLKRPRFIGSPQSPKFSTKPPTRDPKRAATSIDNKDRVVLLAQKTSETALNGLVFQTDNLSNYQSINPSVPKLIKPIVASTAAHPAPGLG